mgnify:FL=1
MTDKVSILMAAYDSQDTIVRAVKSVINQSFSDWELIIIADDSFDYRTFLRRANMEDKRIIYTSTQYPQSGPSIARNYGARSASGNFICTLDSDDYWLPNKLFTLVPIAKDKGISADNIIVINQFEEIICSIFPINGPMINCNILDIVQLNTPIFPIFHRDIFGSGYNEDFQVAEDIVLNIECLSRTKNTLHITNECLTCYVQHSNNICNKAESFESSDKAYDLLISLVKSKKFGLNEDEIDPLLNALIRKKEINSLWSESIINDSSRSFQEFIKNIDL